MAKRLSDPLSRRLRSLRTDRSGFGFDAWKRNAEPPKRIRDEIERRKALVRVASHVKERERWQRLVDYVRAELKAERTLREIRKSARTAVDGWADVTLRDVRDAARECRD